MLEFDTIQSFLTVLLLLTVGEFASRRLKAMLPAVLVAGILFVALVWANVLPDDLVERTGLTGLTPIAITLMILNMGASTNFRELGSNWRVVVLAASVFVLQLAALFAVIGGIFGINTAVGGLPGGMATALIVQEKARSLGYTNLVVLSVLLLCTQGLAASPIVSAMVKKEAVRLRGAAAAVPAPVLDAKEAEQKEESYYIALLKLLAGAWLASRLEMLTGVSRYVLCLFLGVALAAVGFLKKGELSRTKSEGLLFIAMLAMVLGGFVSATPDMFATMLFTLLCVLATELASITLFSLLIGKPLGFSREMSIAIGMNTMVGFPLNMMIARDVVGFITDDPDERERLTSGIATKLIIGGFTSTTFLATVAAGLLSGLMR